MLRERGKVGHSSERAFRTIQYINYCLSNVGYSHLRAGNQKIRTIVCHFASFNHHQNVMDAPASYMSEAWGISSDLAPAYSSAPADLLRIGLFRRSADH